MRVSDPLAEVLQDLRIVDGSYGRCELVAPWGLSFQTQVQARFHLVVAGRCALREPSGRWRWLETGDAVVVPRGTLHRLASKPNGRTRPLEDYPLDEIGDRAYEVHVGRGTPSTVLVCCSVTFGEVGMAPLLAIMPPVLLLRGASQRDPLLRAIVDAMTEEVRTKRVGAATIMVRLADVMITRVIREWAESRHADTRGWLAAIRDPRIGRVLAAIHERPGDSWSLASLAKTARMSRSVLAERFAAIVGTSPARYLTRWRMHLACGWLRRDRTSVAEAAARLGYGSEAAFSRAFKRYAGRPPSAMRRQGGPRAEPAWLP